MNALEDLYERLKARSKHIVLSGPHTQPLFMMDKAGFLDRLGRDNVCADIELALARARVILGLPPAPSSDPLYEEKQRIEAARQEFQGTAAKTMIEFVAETKRGICAATAHTADIDE